MKRAVSLYATVPARGGFTLVEIVLAIAIIATTFVAILGLLPAGLDASRQAASSTIVATIFEDLHQRIQREPLEEGPLSFSPAYFDERGIFIPAGTIGGGDVQTEPFYRADVKITGWQDPPVGTDVKTRRIRPVVIELSWPVNTKTGEAIGPDNPKSVVSYPATTLTGPDWETIVPPGRDDLAYRPRIEF